MKQPDRKGFTLVEMLVVIVVIAMLMGLALPAIVGARARARRTQCGNNQHELAVAIKGYENAQHRLPGYVNRVPAVGSGGQGLSWPVVLLQYLGRNDLWQEWRDPGTSFGSKPRGRISQLVCPVDVEAGDNGLSYVVNCGLDDARTTGAPVPTPPDPPDTPVTGIFLNRFRTDITHVPVMSEKIPDGAGQTLMLSENLQAGYWYDQNEAYLGMVWTPAPQDANGNGLVDDGDDPPAGWYHINEKIDVGSRPGNIHYSRPSSHHTGGVVVTYCDGHQGFLDEDVDYDVYRAEMVPHDEGANAAGEYFLP